MFDKLIPFKNVADAEAIYLQNGSDLMAVGFPVSLGGAWYAMALPEPRSYLELLVMHGDVGRLTQCVGDLQQQPRVVAYLADKCEKIACGALRHDAATATGLLRSLCAYPPFQQFIAGVDLGSNSEVAKMIRVKSYKENVIELRALFPVRSDVVVDRAAERISSPYPG